MTHIGAVSFALSQPSDNWPLVSLPQKHCNFRYRSKQKCKNVFGTIKRCASGTGSIFRHALVNQSHSFLIMGSLKWFYRLQIHNERFEGVLNLGAWLLGINCSRLTPKPSAIVTSAGHVRASASFPSLPLRGILPRMHVLLTNDPAVLHI